MEQFEQLLRAADEVDAAARPLPLFYALSQAGRAIVAARGDDPDIDGHGLVEDREHTPDDLIQRRIKRASKGSGKDAFGAVARATGSPDISGGVEIGAVWATLPDTYRLPKESWLPDWRPALWLIDQPSTPAVSQMRFQAWSMNGNPHHGPEETMGRDRYPTLPRETKWSVKGNSDSLGGPGNWAVVVEWSDTNDLDKIAPEIGMDHEARHLIPTLPGQPEALSPLMTWWLLLFGLSIFARYHPGLWVGALQVDPSPAAVPLEAVLDRALDRLPRLVYEQLIGPVPNESP